MVVRMLGLVVEHIVGERIAVEELLVVVAVVVAPVGLDHLERLPLVVGLEPIVGIEQLRLVGIEQLVGILGFVGNVVGLLG